MVVVYVYAPRTLNGGENIASHGGTPDQIYRARAGLPLRTVQLQCSLYARISRLEVSTRELKDVPARFVEAGPFLLTIHNSRKMRHFAHCTLYLVSLLVLTTARSAETNPGTNSINDQTSRSTVNGNVFGDLRQMYQIYKECSEEDLSPCLKVRLLSAIDRVSRSSQLNVADGVTFVQEDRVANEDEPAKSLQEIEASLPRALDDKEDALNTMIFDKVMKFFQSHTLKLKLPNVEELQRSLVEEGRKKKKNIGGLLAIPLLIGGTLVPLALGALALLAGKALIVSKLALVLASIIGLKKLVSGGGEHSGHEVVQVAGGHGSSGWARSSHDLAYSAYKPSST